MHKKNIISLGGLPGSGKSTVKKILVEHFGWKQFSTGDFMRHMALQRGISFDEFNALIAQDKRIDEEIDAELIRIEASEDQMIIDSHLAFHFVPSSYKVFLDISLDTSAQRIFKDGEKETRKSVGDTMASVEEAKARIAARIDNHNDRYMRHYGVSPYDKNCYDLVIDTETKTPAEVAAIIVDEFAKRQTATS
jgi:cytidylate kinase